MARFEHVSGNTGCLYLRGNCIPVYCMSEKEWIIMDSGSRYDREELIRFLGENAILRVCLHGCPTDLGHSISCDYFLYP